MVGLVDHARRELEIVETDPWMIDGIVNVVDSFAAMGHSGDSASFAIPIINELLQFHNLSPLTDDPKEWMNISGDGWQNVRCSEAFSNDGGKTYYLLSEGGSDVNREPLHNTVHKEL